jgi:hypothetical protein
MPLVQGKNPFSSGKYPPGGLTEDGKGCYNDHRKWNGYGEKRLSYESFAGTGKEE